MFIQLLSKHAVNILRKIAPSIEQFYLAGGTSLALQIGHRRSDDLDFFTATPFDPQYLINDLAPENVPFVRKDTLYCEVKGVKVSFMLYQQPLLYPLISWNEINLADWRDISAEKMKTISQRGAKKDFYDLYAVLKLKLSIQEVCELFVRKFQHSKINNYHVLKSLVYFDDAESDPEPIIMHKGNAWKWDSVKTFFKKNVTEFEKYLLQV